MNILIISVGGTISQKHTQEGFAVSNDDAFKGDTFSEIISATAQKLGIDAVDSKTILNKDSSNMTSGDWELIAGSIVEGYDKYDAFIVTHGTNTMAYTTAAVSLALGNLGKPVLFTGSQISYDIPGSDATINLENILRVLKEKPELVGVFLIFGSKIISGMKAKKTTEFNYDAFKTFGRYPDIGYIGNSIALNNEAMEDHLRYLGSKAEFKIDLDIKNNFDTNIVSLTEFPGMNPDIIINLAKSGLKGFILRATGAGDPNVAPEGADYPNLRGAFEYLRDNKIPIVVTTQAPDGIATMNMNEPGVLAHKLGAIPAYDMSMEAMVTKLSWLLAQNCSYEEIQQLMLTSFRGEIHR